MRNIDKGSPLVAEIWGALVGLHLAQRLGANHLILEMDNKDVVDITIVIGN